MPLYFAYGANMDLATMALRCPASRPVTVARLPRHRFIINTDGYATVVRDARAEVHGVLWNLAQGDVRALDRFEEVDTGLYSKIMQPVFTAEGPRRAMLYLGRSAAPGRPRPSYLENIIASAAHWQLPAAYRAGLAAWLTSRSGPAVQPLAAREMGPVAGVTPRALRPASTLPARSAAGGIPARAGDAWQWGDDSGT
jgi:gamma-glutamylcyclotransferase (GGCT)/AIG2-like uncharacterized protein YtfP